MASYILDKQYRIHRDNGVGAYLVVVQGVLPGDAILPSDSVVMRVPLGITVHSQNIPDAGVAVRKAGIAKVIAYESFPAGEPLFYMEDGRVCDRESYKQFHPNAKWAWCIGFSETQAEEPSDIAEVFIAIHQFHFLAQEIF